MKEERVWERQSLLSAPFSVLGPALARDSRKEVMPVSKRTFKPGEKAPDSGQYEIVGPRGGDAGGKERTVTSGEPLPPTPKPNQKYILRDRTKH